jgi:hypothetical protein
MYFPVDQPGLPPEQSAAMEIELEEGANSYGAEHPRGCFSRTRHSLLYFSNLRRVLFGTLSKLYFQQNISPHISHDTDNIMIHYDTVGD